MAITSPTTDTNGLGDLSILPPEVRNEIYRHALVAVPCITISECTRSRETRRTGKGFKNSLSERSSIRAKVTKDQPKGKRHSPVHFTLAINLLGTSRTIYLEAAGLFWHGNLFTFTTFFALRTFLHMIGDKVDSLGHIEVLAVRSRTGFQEELSALCGAKQMESINIPALCLDGSLRTYHDGLLGTLGGPDGMGVAEDTWLMVKDFVTLRRVKGLKGNIVMVELEEEERLRRLAALKFSVAKRVLFDTDQGRKMRIEDNGERQKAFNNLLRDLLLKDLRLEGRK